MTLIHDEQTPSFFEGRRMHVEVEEPHVGNIPRVAGLGNERSEGKPLPSDYTGGEKGTGT
jgi:hypothetical protein